MPEARPFAGILYDPARILMENVVAPPYDVISKQRQQELYDASPFNVIRLILGLEEDRYLSAATYYKQWTDSGILVRDAAPAIYILSQLFRTPDGRDVERMGFIAACRLEDFGKGSVFPHETTFANPKEDRFRLFQATDAMFSQIFALYSDPGHRLDEPIHLAMRHAPVLTAEFEHVLNVVWRLTDPRAISAIAAFLADQKVFVADGHHRYETALLYRDSMRLRSPGYDSSEPFNFVPMYFTNMNDEGLVILPTHRILHSLPESTAQGLLQAVRSRFMVDAVSSAGELAASLHSHPRGAFGLVLPGGPRFYLVRRRASDALLGPDVPAPLRDLDVLLLHRVIFGELLGVTEAEQTGKRFVDYEKEPGLAADAVRSGRAQAAILLNPTSIDQVRAVAEAGLTMPQKSTYFYPKLLSGLVTYSFSGPGLP